MQIPILDTKPVNIDLIRVNESDLPRLGKISSGQIFDVNGNFHSDSLFSVTTFGSVGSEHRNRTFGHIDLGVTIMHPMIYYAVIKLKALHKQIIEGKAMAIFDVKKGEFVKSTEEKADTGYNFFMTYLTELKFEKNQSDKRNYLIDLFNISVKENKATMRYLLVLPAGLRDYTVDPSGKPQEDEINGIYRKIIAQSSIVDQATLKKNPQVYDNVASGIQTGVYELSEYIFSLLEGKNKLVLGKWLSRKIFNSTRNVASTYIDKSDDINDPRKLKYNEVAVGIHQFARALVPLSVHHLLNRHIKKVFTENSNTATLVNIKTLKKEEVLNTHVQKDHDLWMSFDGVVKVIASLGSLSIRSLPITVNKGAHYLGLIYQDDEYFKFLQDIDDVPEGFDRSKVRPITYTEFIYLSMFELDGKYPGLVTRYPITGYGSVYPAYIKLVVTSKSYRLIELSDSWEPTDVVANAFPDINSEYFNTLAPHVSHIGRLSADYDGDTLSLTAVLTDEGREEIDKLFKSKHYYFTDDGSISFSNSNDTLSAVLSYMT